MEEIEQNMVLPNQGMHSNDMIHKDLSILISLQTRKK